MAQGMAELLPSDNSSSCSSEILLKLETSSSPPYMMLQLLDVALCCIGMKLMGMAERELRTVFLSTNLKVLLRVQKFFMTLYCVTFIPIMSFHFFQRFTNSGCDLLVPVRYCVLFRIFQSWSIVFLQLFYIGVLADTCGTLFSTMYRSLETKGAYLIVVIMAVISFMATAPSFPIDWNSDKLMVNCASLEHKPVSTQRIIFIWFLFLDSISIVLFVILQQFRKREMSNPVFKYNINKTLAAKELLRVIRMIFPILCFNTCCYAYFAIVSLINTTMDEDNDPIRFLFANSVPLYICGTPLIWMYIARRADMKIGVKKIKSNFDRHFVELDRFWREHSDENSNREASNTPCVVSHPERLFDNTSINISVVSSTV